MSISNGTSFFDENGDWSEDGNGNDLAERGIVLPCTQSSEGHAPHQDRVKTNEMEEFRPIIADSVVLGVINNRILQHDDFIQRGPATTMTQDGRKKFLRAYEKRLDQLVTHPVFGYRIAYRRVLDVQARLFGRCLAGELKEYPSFRVR